MASSLSIFKSNQVLQKEMATHSSILGWRIPWTEEPAGLWSMGSQRVGHVAHTHSLVKAALLLTCPNLITSFPLERLTLWDSPSGVMVH